MDDQRGAVGDAWTSRSFFPRLHTAAAISTCCVGLRATGVGNRVGAPSLCARQSLFMGQAEQFG